MYRTDVVPELVGRQGLKNNNNPQICANESTGPQAYRTLWLVKFPGFLCADWSINPRADHARCSPQFLDERANRPFPEPITLGDLYSPRFPNERAGRPVPEHIVLGGRYSPRFLE